MMTPRNILTISCLAVFIFLYQNCALQNKSSFDENQNWPSKIKIHVSDSQSNKFFIWNFISKEKTRVEIKNYNNSFCKREFLLDNSYRRKWIGVFNLYKKLPKDSDLEQKSSIYLTVNDNEKREISKKVGEKIFQLMEETKKNHRMKISNCQSHKKWSFRKLKSENLIKTKSGSKFLQTMIIENYKTQKLTVLLKEEPIRIKEKRNGEAFCNYELTTYSPSPQLLTLMFFVDELNKGQVPKNNRSLASSKKSKKSILVQIDNQSIKVPQNSELGQSISYTIGQIKDSQSILKSCGYSY